MSKTASRAATVLALAVPETSQAHVKWFAEFSFADRPSAWTELATPTFWVLLFLSAFAMAGAAWFEHRFGGAPWHAGVDRWLESKRPSSLTVMRVGVFAVMLLCWQADAVLVPELEAPAAWVGWLLFVIALLTLFDRTVPLAGVGLIAVYGIGVQQFGWLHMLDYPLYAGAGLYLLTSAPELKSSRSAALPALYLTVGFSLCWVALEKLVYPEWALTILAERSELTLGLEPEFFLVGAAFVELVLGYVLIIGMLSRPMALVITLVFFTTTLVFGKVEVIGHTLIHAALIVFLIEGPGQGWRPPVRFHRTLPMRMAFAAVNFVLLVALLTAPYLYLAGQAYEGSR